MGKAPAFQFYVKDWLSDTQLQMASHSTKGIWVDMLCYMWEAPKRSEIEGTEKQIGKMVRASKTDFDLFMIELKKLKFGDLVQNNNGTITIRNRRMAREQDQRELAKKRQQRFREKKLPREKDQLRAGSVRVTPERVIEQDQRELAESSPIRVRKKKRKYNADITPISPSPFPSPSSKKNKFVNSALRIFEFWQEKMEKPRSKFTPERSGKILARLKDGYSEKDCFKAVENCAKSPYHRGENPDGREYVSINLIFRNGEKLEYFRDMVFKGPKGRGGLKGGPEDLGDA